MATGSIPIRLVALAGALAILAPGVTSGQTRFLARCGLYAGSQTTLQARPHAKAICQCYADRIRAARDIPAADKRRLLQVRPGPKGRISIATIQAMERINRQCWQQVRRKRG